MCGICGYVHLDRAKRPSEAILKGMMDTLAPRGPDDQGMYVRGNVALGHRRLSIIDLRTGHQPIVSRDGARAIVYNGEVYNFPELKTALIGKGHTFSTNSDTEVVLHAYEEYGEDCVRHFNGMFAFAVWNAQDESLFLARDRFGKKPLYYSYCDDQFIFGSELKAVLKHPSAKKEIDLSALAKYLAYEYVPSPFSIFKNIRKLEAGSTLFLKNRKMNIRRYWDLSFDRRQPFDPAEAEARLVDLLRESVRKRLISDVPLGVFLSGGIDSSAIVAMMAELIDPRDIKTFSVGFREASFDESSDARRIADHFGTDHHEEILDPHTMLEVFPAVAGFLDEPFADASIIPTYLVSRFTRQYVKVALGGDGGDELFLGYPSFVAQKIHHHIRFLPRPVRKLPFAALAALAPATNGYMSLNFKARRFLRGMDFADEVRHQAWLGAFTPAEERRLFRADRLGACDLAGVYAPTSALSRRAAGLDPFDRAIYLYANTYMTDDVLVKVDRASMANSLEVRAPFLDAEFSAFAAGIPPSYKLKGLTTKWILKQALRGKVPDETLFKPKQGFAVPVARWLKEDLRGLLLDALGEDKIKREGIFDHAAVLRLVRDFLAGRHDTRREIWSLFMFEIWYDKWLV